jgi:AraC-like DNA-binding protein
LSSSPECGTATAPRSTGWDEFWIGFKGEIMDRLVAGGVFSPQNPVFDVGLSEELLDHFQQCDRLCERQPIGFRQMLSARAAMILAQVQALAQQREIGDAQLEGCIRKARFTIAEHLDRPIDMAVLAREFHLSYSHFRRLFKRYTGLAPSQYHLQLRLNKAKELLRATSLSIKEICGQLGFHDPYYFSRLFKAKAGLSPRRWRQY